jgi:hypothetical protein
MLILFRPSCEVVKEGRILRKIKLLCSFIVAYYGFKPAVGS